MPPTTSCPTTTDGRSGSYSVRMPSRWAITTIPRPATEPAKTTVPAPAATTTVPERAVRSTPTVPAPYRCAGGSKGCSTTSGSTGGWYCPVMLACASNRVPGAVDPAAPG